MIREYWDELDFRSILENYFRRLYGSKHGEAIKFYHRMFDKKPVKSICLPGNSLLLIEAKHKITIWKPEKMEKYSISVPKNMVDYLPLMPWNGSLLFLCAGHPGLIYYHNGVNSQNYFNLDEEIMVVARFRFMQNQLLIKQYDWNEWRLDEDKLAKKIDISNIVTLIGYSYSHRLYHHIRYIYPAGIHE